MKKYPVVRACWYVVNLLLAVSLVALLYSATWEFLTQNYLRGFSDAIVSSSDNPEQKAEAILGWMAHGPARRSAPAPSALALRDPENTLNLEHLLDVCGTATNAFVNLAESSGLHARRLLLLDQKLNSKHIVVEVLIDNRWVVVDPAYRTFLRLPNGHMVTRDELKNPAIFQAAVQAVPGYPQSYTYERAVHVRMKRIPVIGPYARRILNLIWPSWEVSINWNLLLERESFAMLVASTFLLFFAVTVRFLLAWYCSQRLRIPRVRLRDQMKRAGQVLVNNPVHPELTSR